MTLAGHGRLEAAKLVGLSEVPVIVLEGLSEAKKRALVLADNKIAENAGVRPSLVKVRYGSKRASAVGTSSVGRKYD
jgi:ParB-like chromosome segregation protein Spo0J